MSLRYAVVRLGLDGAAPAGAKVTLRTSAADAAGGSITESITSAYQTAS